MTADDCKDLKARKDRFDRHITFGPENRPEVANLLMLASLATGEDPVVNAEGNGDGGGGALKATVKQRP